MGKSFEVPVDWVKLEAVLRKRGLTMSEVSTGMGHSMHYMSQQKSDGILKKKSAVFLDKVYGIRSEDYAPEGIREEKGKDQISYATIYDAVYRAMKMALAEVLSGDLQAAHRRQDGAD